MFDANRIQNLTSRRLFLPQGTTALVKPNFQAPSWYIHAPISPLSHNPTCLTVPCKWKIANKCSQLAKAKSDSDSWASFLGEFQQVPPQKWLGSPKHGNHMHGLQTVEMLSITYMLTEVFFHAHLKGLQDYHYQNVNHLREKP